MATRTRPGDAVKAQYARNADVLEQMLRKAEASGPPTYRGYTVAALKQIVADYRRMSQ